MTFNPGLTIGQIITNDDLCRIFQCSSQGRMRRSHTTNTLVITSNPMRPVSQDVWRGNVLHYTGMGTKGDQDINFAQNKTLNESKTNGVDVFLFEQPVTNQYHFQGRVELADEPFQEYQQDVDGSNRQVWVFPVRVVDQGGPAPLPEETWQERGEIVQRAARRMSDVELERRATQSRESPATRAVNTTQRFRDPFVVEYVKRRANGKCQLCGKDAPFVDKQGKQYLEEHHIVWLSKDGPDMVGNAVALCPNCHKKMHVLNLDRDVATLREAVGEVN